MFSNEFTIKVKPEGPSTDVASHFVSNGYVKREQGEDGRVHVRAFQDGSTWWAILPTESQDIIPVAVGDLQNA